MDVIYFEITKWHYFDEASGDSFDIAKVVINLIKDLIVTNEHGSWNIYRNLIDGNASCSFNKKIKVRIILTFFEKNFAWAKF